ncbi:hypothetical protein GCM10023235_66800 [Kitasatospora terrestris]|uniref:Uncharacterized protein n=1 Tax=Kitasatospora terrestris TaxID=258051 RepID=A0ABP9EHZ9_9ACTN
MPVAAPGARKSVREPVRLSCRPGRPMAVPGRSGLAAPSRPVKDLLDATGTDAVFAISPSVGAALTDAHTRDEEPS